MYHDTYMVLILTATILLPYGSYSITTGIGGTPIDGIGRTGVDQQSGGPVVLCKGSATGCYSGVRVPYFLPLSQHATKRRK